MAQGEIDTLTLERHAGDDGFHARLTRQFAELNMLVCKEVRRLESIVGELQSENARLRTRSVEKGSSMPQLELQQGELSRERARFHSDQTAKECSSGKLKRDRSSVKNSSSLLSITPSVGMLAADSDPPDMSSDVISNWSSRTLGTSVFNFRKSWLDAQKTSSSGEPVLRFHSTGGFSWIATSIWFEHLTLMLILGNSLWIAAEMDIISEKEQRPALYYVIDAAFVLYFMVEMLIRLLAFRRKRDSLSDGWFVFDAILVSVMVIQSLASIIYTRVVSIGTQRNASVLRLLRLLRLTRVARATRAFPELKMMIFGLMAGTRSVMITTVFLAGLTFVFALVFRSLTNDTAVGKEKFRSVPQSFVSLIVEGMLPDNSDMMYNLSEETWLLGLLFFSLHLHRSLHNHEHAHRDPLRCCSQRFGVREAGDGCTKHSCAPHGHRTSTRLRP
mmetsp:Transcript_27461/g.60094  ORF Transcript_27461/g.60094 Transcript_27461/m.60094 type:complete len:445 (-) Transcript_27461:397-1731(-)